MPLPLHLLIVGGGVYNTEEWITESGNYIVRISGWYWIFLISGGHGGYAPHGFGYALGGNSGKYFSKVMKLKAGEEIRVIIGSGGTGSSLLDGPDIILPGETSFDTISTSEITINGIMMDTTCKASPEYIENVSGGGKWYSLGSGYGGGHPELIGLDGRLGSGRFYGGGGGCANATNKNEVIIGQGAPGAIRLRYYDPSKDELK